MNTVVLIFCKININTYYSPLLTRQFMINFIQNKNNKLIIDISFIDFAEADIIAQF